MDNQHHHNRRITHHGPACREQSATRFPTTYVLTAWQQDPRVCCIEPKGVLATAQSSKAGSTIPVENYDKLGIRALPRGFWAGR
jgi:hypothetical protein